MWGTYAAWVHMVFFPQCGKLWGTKLLIPTLPFILTKFLLRLKFCRNFVEMGKKLWKKMSNVEFFGDLFWKKVGHPDACTLGMGNACFFQSIIGFPNESQSIHINLMTFKTSSNQFQFNYLLSKSKSINSNSIIDFQKLNKSISIQLLALKS